MFSFEFGPTRCSQPAERAARWRERPARTSPRAVASSDLSRRNENFRQFQFAQEVELNLPERFSAKNDRSLVFAHPTRFAAGEQHRAEPMSFAQRIGGIR